MKLKKIVGITTVIVLALNIGVASNATTTTMNDFDQNVVTQDGDDLEGAWFCGTEGDLCDVDYVMADGAVDIEDFTFEMFIKDLDLKLSPTVYKKAEKLFNEALALEEKMAFDKANKKWDELFEMEDLKTVFGSFDDSEAITMTWDEVDNYEHSFDDYKDLIDKKATDKEVKELEALFDKAAALEKELAKAWSDFYESDALDFSHYDE